LQHRAVLSSILPPHVAAFHSKSTSQEKKVHSDSFWIGGGMQEVLYLRGIWIHWPFLQQFHHRLHQPTHVCITVLNKGYNQATSVTHRPYMEGKACFNLPHSLS